MKILVYLTIMLSLIGANVLSLDFGAFKLSIFRFLILLIPTSLVLGFLKKNRYSSLFSVAREQFQYLRGKENFYSLLFLFFWFFYAVLSVFWVKDYSAWFRAVYFIGLGTLSAIILNRFLIDKKDILRAFQVIAVMVIIHNLFGWYEIYTGHYIFLPSERIPIYTRLNHPVSMFGNTNNFANFLLISLFILIICIQNTNHKAIKILCGFTVASSLGLLYYTDSRASIIGLAMAVLAFGFLWVRKKKGLATLSRRRILKGALVLMLLLVVMAVMVNLDFLPGLPRFLTEKLYLRFDAESSSDSIRLNLMRNGFIFLRDTYGFGTGAGNTDYWMKHYSVYNTRGILNLHNWWMEILVGYGVILYGGYILFYGKLLHSHYRKYLEARDPLSETLSLGIFCILVGFIVGSISSSNNIISEWLWVFWGIVIAHQGIGDAELWAVRSSKMPLGEEIDPAG